MSRKQNFFDAVQSLHPEFFENKNIIVKEIESFRNCKSTVSHPHLVYMIVRNKFDVELGYNVLSCGGLFLLELLYENREIIDSIEAEKNFSSFSILSDEKNNGIYFYGIKLTEASSNQK